MEITKSQQLLQQVVTEAWEDEAFKKQLIENPVKAIEELTGEKLNIPEGKTFVVKDRQMKAPCILTYLLSKKWTM